MKRGLLLLVGILGMGLATSRLLSAEIVGEVRVLQGLRSNTQVAGKTTAFRFYADDATNASMARIDAAVTRPDGSRFAQSWSRGEVVMVPKVAGAPASFVVRIAGRDLPWVGSYRFDANVVSTTGFVIAKFSVNRFQMLPTKDLIVGIDRVNANDINPAPAAEIQAARDAMQRLSAIWPIRDGISSPDNDRTVGLRFTINNNPKGYGCDGNPKHSDCQLCPFYAGMINRPAGSDVMNLGIGYRFQDRGEGMGGIAPNFCSNQNVGWASIVANAPLAAGFAQETGHVFTLEPANDPHFDPSVQKGHSKDTKIDLQDSALGFDIQTNQPFPATTFDAMHQVVCGCPNNEVAYNAWDWEYLRQQFVKLSSTGPTTPAHFSTDVGPAVAGVGNSVYFVARRTDGRIFYNRAVLGQAGVGWVEMEGNGYTNAAPAAAAIGSHVFVAVKGPDNRIYINQADEGKSFGQWFPMDFRTDVAPALASVKNSIFVFAKGMDKRIYVSQAVLGQGFSGWFEVQGGGQSDRSPSAAAIGEHLFVAIRGLDGTIQLNQADLGHAFGQWFPMTMKTDEAPALTSVANSIFVFAKTLDGRIQLSQAELSHGFSGWFDVQGNGRTNAAPAAGTVGKHVFVAVKGVNNLVSVNQADFGSAFGAWIW
jgi:hypothetical protein